MKLNNQDEKIVLKDGYNKKLIAGIILTTLVFVFMIFSKYYLPDDRPMFNKNHDTKLFFGRVTIYSPEEFIYDKEKNILEMRLQEKRVIKDAQKENEITYEFLDSNNKMIPYALSKSTCKAENENDLSCLSDVMVQVQPPKNFYGLSVLITQKDTSMNHIDIDYRSVVVDTLKEKGNDFYKQIELIEDTLSENQDKIKTINEQIKKLDKTKDEKAINEKQVEKEKINTLINELKLNLSEARRQ